MTQPQPAELDAVTCRACGRPLDAPTSRALHHGPTCFARLIASTGGRRIGAIHEGQLILFDRDMEDLVHNATEGATR